MKERDWYKMKIVEMMKDISDLRILIEIYSTVKDYYNKLKERKNGING